MVVRPTDPAGSDAVAIVTGASSPAGREIARELASRGYAVVVVYLGNQAEAEAAVAEILAANATALAVRADVADELDVERLFAETAAAFGSVDVVVQTAGPGSSVVNEHASRQLRRGGAIVNVSSTAAIEPALADELRARDITVSGLAPGREGPGPDHDVAEVVGLVDVWRAKTRAMTPGLHGRGRSRDRRACDEPRSGGADQARKEHDSAQHQRRP